MKLGVAVSRRHVHLTADACQKLFGSTDLPKRNDLSQPGQFATLLTVDLKWNNNIVEHVRVVGPLRKYNQIEVTSSETSILGVNPPIRQSGDLEGSLPITLIGPMGEVNLESGLIIAERHVHMTKEDAKKLNVTNKEIVSIKKNNKEIFKSKVKIQDLSYLELHIDTYEEKLYDLHQGDEVEICKIGL